VKKKKAKKKKMPKNPWKAKDKDQPKMVKGRTAC
jgi:hypothetical protein